MLESTYKKNGWEFNMKSPNQIPNLRLWFDASDISTINDGRVVDGQNVSKWVDKIGGYTLRNPNGSQGPIYELGTSSSVMNGKNRIRFDYYTTPNSNVLKRLASNGVLPLSSATYSLFCVFHPNDVRFERQSGPSEYQMVMTNINQTRFAQQQTGYQERVIFSSTWQSPTQKNTDIGYLDSNAPWTSATSFFYDRSRADRPDYRSISSGPLYAFGKVNIVNVRAQNAKRRYAHLRKDFYYSDNFIPRDVRHFAAAVSVANPCLVIGAGWGGPTETGSGTEAGGWITQTRNLASVTNVKPFEGRFCELLFWDRFLTDREVATVEIYLRNKWFER